MERRGGRGEEGREEKGEGGTGRGGQWRGEKGMERTTLLTPCRKFLATPLMYI